MVFMLSTLHRIEESKIYWVIWKRALALAYTIYFLIDFLFLWSAKTCWNKTLKNINYQTNEQLLKDDMCKLKNHIQIYPVVRVQALEFPFVYFWLQGHEKRNSLVIKQNLSNQRFFWHWSCVGIYLNKCDYLIFLPEFPFQTNYRTNHIIRSDSQRYFCSKR